jgi:hypothetical protein
MKQPNELKTKLSKKTETKPDGYTLLATVFEKHILHFDIGDSVYLKTDPEQCERLVTGVNIRQNGISYALSHLTNESYHYDFEISKDRDIIKATSS